MCSCSAAGRTPFLNLRARQSPPPPPHPTPSFAPPALSVLPAHPRSPTPTFPAALRSRRCPGVVASGRDSGLPPTSVPGADRSREVNRLGSSLAPAGGTYVPLATSAARVSHTGPPGSAGHHSLYAAPDAIRGFAVTEEPVRTRPFRVPGDRGFTVTEAPVWTRPFRVPVRRIGWPRPAPGRSSAAWLRMPSPARDPEYGALRLPRRVVPFSARLGCRSRPLAGRPSPTMPGLPSAVRPTSGPSRPVAGPWSEDGLPALPSESASPLECPLPVWRARQPFPVKGKTAPLPSGPAHPSGPLRFPEVVARCETPSPVPLLAGRVRADSAKRAGL
jgi:hypothetical protein